MRYDKLNKKINNRYNLTDNPGSVLSTYLHFIYLFISQGPAESGPKRGLVPAEAAPTNFQVGERDYLSPCSKASARTAFYLESPVFPMRLQCLIFLVVVKACQCRTGVLGKE